MAQARLEQVASSARVPGAYAKIYKEECAYSFHTAEDEGGVMVDLNSFIAFSPEFCKLNYAKTSHSLYLNVVKKRVPRKDEETKEATSTKVDEPAAKRQQLTVELSDVPKDYEYEYTYSLVLQPDELRIAYPNQDVKIPEAIASAANAVISRDSALKQDATKMVNLFDQSVESQYSFGLLQLDNGVKVPRHGWKCAVCGLEENLWLNITDGFIGCGRSQIGVVQGNNHALEHYKQTTYPVAVKLGSISAEGAEVWSYADDNMIKAPLLDQWLLHWGIDLKAMKKTEMSVAELAAQANNSFEWSRAEERGKTLENIFGPGYTGIINLGNTCYMNSILQLLFTVPSFIKRYGAAAQDIFNASNPSSAPKDFHVQMAKFAQGLLSGRHSIKQTETKDEQGLPKYSPNCVKPWMLKAVVGGNHKEFSTLRQQDASEFFQYLMEFVTRKEKLSGGLDPTQVFRFYISSRLECQASKNVRYTKRVDNVLSLPIPLDKSTNMDQVIAWKEAQSKLTQEQIDKSKRDKTFSPVYPSVNLTDCINAWASTETIDGFFSTAIQGRTTANKSSKFSTFPPYLVIQMQKFVFEDGWVPKKLEATLNAPDELDIEYLRCKGLQPNEKELPEDKKQAAAPAASTFQVNEVALSSIMSMGLSISQAKAGLKATDNNVERAIEWIFSHPDIPPEEEAAPQEVVATPDEKLDDGKGKYQLHAFVTHVGKNLDSGHYLIHILKDGKWVVFNDSKVALSQDPPRDLAYLYIYKRC